MKQISPKGHTTHRNTLPLNRTALWATRSFQGMLGRYIGMLACAAVLTGAPVARARQASDAAGGAQSAQTEATRLTLFGTTLKGATREQMRASLRRRGVSVIKSAPWIDVYDARRTLEGVTTLRMGYVRATQKFAIAEYTFPSVADTQQVSRIIAMVSEKYGQPQASSGNLALGAVQAEWQLPGRMRIVVDRKWPDTTTYLNYVDDEAFTEQQAEYRRYLGEEHQKKSAAQDDAL